MRLTQHQKSFTDQKLLLELGLQFHCQVLMAQQVLQAQQVLTVLQVQQVLLVLQVLLV